jgi:hypothetical protein
MPYRADQLKRMFGTIAESYERYIRSLPGGCRADVRYVDLACDHLMTQANDDWCHERQAVLALVGDQDA